MEQDMVGAPHILILVAQHGDLTPERYAAHPFLKTLNPFGPPRVLQSGVAMEWNVPAAMPPTDFVALRREFSSDHVDVFHVPADHRRKKLLLADMDATIVVGETLDELAARWGVEDKIAAITAAAMRGEVDFKQALEQRVAMLAGLPETALADTLAAMTLHRGAETLVQVMRFFGAVCYLVSGGFTFFTSAIADRCGFHGHHGNVLDIVAGRLTGRVLPPILDKDAKRMFLTSYAKQARIGLENTMAVGDGANDIPMLQAAGVGVGFQPKPKVADVIPNQIIHTDLTSLLYIQGYTAEDIAQAMSRHCNG